MAKLYIRETQSKGHLNAEIQGHFAEHLGRCIYSGLFVGKDADIPNVNGMRTDVVNALKELQIPVLRWPGGCFADEYHWMDGIGPKEDRKKMINTHWGGVLEDNSFGTHEFFELCEQLGCKTYVNANVGSGTVREMSEWVEYMTFDGVSPMADLRKKNGREKPWRVDYLGVGNENWGCGGNMTPEYYANLYRQYQTYVRQYDPSNPISKICCGANVSDYCWTRDVLSTCYYNAPEHLHGFMDGLSLHYYTTPNNWSSKGSATDFDQNAYYKTLKKAMHMEELIERHSAIMDEFDPDTKIGMIVDEWGCWFDVEPDTNPGFLYQQNTMRDALVASITLDIFNQHADRVKMANLAQMVNVLQSVILTDGDQMLLTPTYHVFHMYKYHQDAELLDSYFEGVNVVGDPSEYKMPQLSHTVSIAADGYITATISNLSSTDEVPVELAFTDLCPRDVQATMLSQHMQAHNTFENPDAVKEVPFSDYELTNRSINFQMPPCSIVRIRVKA
ncbi:MAG: alpha-N-arabinofuranosidase [Clostridiales bacterium]|nr:alpha-N-arabinofuranosidase [Clostridiales bacterium]